MGTSLTGTKPKDTYDSLIKVGDNGPISGTAKYLSDGLGNDLPIAVSTSNVGIGTSAPLGKLSVADAALSTLALTATGEATDQKTWIYQYGAAVGAGTFRLRSVNDAASDGQNAVIITRTGFNVDTHRFLTSGSERFRITDNGVTFNGDTAAANALDDYEEGTWSPVIRGSGTAGTYEQATTFANYTKIGRQVTLNCQINLASSITAGGTGYLQITGAPFTKAASQEAMGSCWFLGVDFAGSFVTPRFIAAAGTSTTVYFVETVDNSNAQDMAISGIAANDIINFSMTYFV